MKLLDFTALEGGDGVVKQAKITSLGNSDRKHWQLKYHQTKKSQPLQAGIFSPVEGTPTYRKTVSKPTLLVTP